MVKRETRRAVIKIGAWSDVWALLRRKVATLGCMRDAVTVGDARINAHHRSDFFLDTPWRRFYTCT
ncbi:MAG: hypothetical protein ACYC6M_06955 [Terriglobales bacterium]